MRHKLELTGESVVWSLLDETVLFSIYKLIEFADILKIKKDHFIFVKWP